MGFFSNINSDPCDILFEKIKTGWYTDVRKINNSEPRIWTVRYVRSGLGIDVTFSICPGLVLKYIGEVLKISIEDIEEIEVTAQFVMDLFDIVVPRSLTYDDIDIIFHIKRKEMSPENPNSIVTYRNIDNHYNMISKLNV